MKNQGISVSKVWLMTIMLFSITIINTSAQPGEKKVVVNEVNVNDLPEVKYIQLVGVKENGVLTVEVDYGVKIPSGKRTITGEDGKPKTFDSMIAALNFMDKNGWSFVNAYEARATERTVYHFILKKKDELDNTEFSKN